ncbi:MAG: histidinol dehydrogenase [Candidatus Saccharicenans sp.]|nr:histidinol dehydrogenase [Candidatus Saccharicenans sp.]
MKIINGDKIDIKKIKKFQEIPTEILSGVLTIIQEVSTKGDEALIKITEKLDGCRLSSFRVNIKEELSRIRKLDPHLKSAIRIAVKNVRQVARKQKSILLKAVRPVHRILPGVYVKQEIIPVKRAGIYVPAGRYPLISSLYMGVIPALEAGVQEIVVCTPPDKEGSIPVEIIYLADLLGIKEIYKIGGAQAIAAMALGTQTINPVDFIAGPGNIYVNAAKKLLYGKVGIDFIAGPTELLIIADSSASPEWVAADLLAQAEHDVLAKPFLITFDRIFANRVKIELEKQLSSYSHSTTASEALRKNGMIMICKNYSQAAYLANELAPEHLAVYLKNPEKIINNLYNYGCLFVGEYTAEVFGDYCAGSNHILPTNGTGRYRGGLSVVDFLKLVTQIRITEKGARTLASATIRIAQREGLILHARSARLRAGKSDKR